jgi:hypothetical protein
MAKPVVGRRFSEARHDEQMCLVLTQQTGYDSWLHNVGT